MTDRVLDADYLGDLGDRPIEEIRAMRSECQRVEVRLSYLRRLVQGRLDILRADLDRRARGDEAPDLAHLVGQLPEILSDHVLSPGPGRLPTYLAPGDVADLTREVDVVVEPATLTALSDLDETEVRRIADQLAEQERDLSDRRRRLHEHIDALQAELTRRYKTGEASVETLLQ